MATPLRAKKLTELLIDEIKVLIEADQLQPGERIPTEQQLMAIFKVSRTCVRDALSVLRQEGLVDIIQGKGTFLKTRYTPLPDVNDPSSQGWGTFMEARNILECSLARLAAERASPEEIEAMSMTVALLEEEEKSSFSDKVIEADLDFHYALARASGNPVLLHLLQQVDSHLQKGRSTTISFPQGRKKAHEGHKKILEEIRAKNPEGAALQMGRHIEEIEKAQKKINVLQNLPATGEVS